MCEDAGFTNVRTYIASGNVVFGSKAAASKVKAELERRLQKHAGKPVGVMIRTAKEMAAVIEANPFPRTEPKLTYVVFLDEAVPKDWRDGISGLADEELRAAKREIFVHYPSGMGRSKLKIRATRIGTARNLNTVTKLAEMAAEQ
jgi:uncharacterized protein (DUF1697 family)